MNLLGVPIPRLPDAACLDRHALFDLTAANDPDPYVVSAALRVCAGCPARARCEQWFTALPASARPFGVTAGRYRRPRRTESKEKSVG